jgi:hypothetical protein
MKTYISIIKCFALVALAVFNLKFSNAHAQGVFYTNWSDLVTNWVQTSAPSTNNYPDSCQWSAVASSADGTKLLASGNEGLFASTNSGDTWTCIVPSSVYEYYWWGDLASSADGTVLAGTSASMGSGILVSTNSGVTWALANVPAGSWNSIACSADGSKMVAVMGTTVDTSSGTTGVGAIYTSADSGATWTQTSAPTNVDWCGVASSADGTKLAAVPYLRGQIWTSTNSGVAWIQTSSPVAYWYSIASSSDGTKLAAGGTFGFYISTDSGVTWTPTSGPSGQDSTSIACSADGTKLVVAGTGGIYISINSGATWTQPNAPKFDWQSAASSADGTKLFAATCFAGQFEYDNWMYYYGEIWSTHATIVGLTTPIISNQPASATVSRGGNVTFNVAASGDDLSYQWAYNGANISGATNAALILTNCGSANVGSYTVTVSNPAANTTSQPATLMVLPVVLNGGFETGTFTNWTLTGNTPCLSVSTKSDYVHSGNYGVQAGPAGTLGWLSQTLVTLPGQPYMLSLWLDSPDGGAPNEFTVYWNGTPLFDDINLGAIGWTNLQFIVGATSASSQLQIGVRNDPAYFGFDDVCVTPISSISPLIIQQPASHTLLIGGNVSFNVMAVGSPPLACQWYFNTNTPVDGATNTLLSFGPVMTNQAGNYQVIITNLYGSATSSPAALTVQLIPNICSISCCAGGAATLYLTGIPGSTNRLWASTNLVQWQVVATNTAGSNGFFQITDTNAIGHGMMFYRLSWP